MSNNDVTDSSDETCAVTTRGPAMRRGPDDATFFVVSDGYFTVDLVAWKVAFDRVAVRHAPVFKVTLMVVVVV